MANSAVISSVRQKYHALAPFLHEKARRRWAACEALALGRGGISVVAWAAPRFLVHLKWVTSNRI